MGTGTKILHFKHNHLILKDSLSFLNMPLSNFPKTFGLTELKKGHFPHLFNIVEHQEYVGPLPPKEFYMPETMSVKDRQEFDTWYESRSKKPVYTGFSVLDLSKVLMYQFHYNHMKKKYDDRARLLFTDTDSLMYHVVTDDIYQDMLEDLDKFDTLDLTTFSTPMRIRKS